MTETIGFIGVGRMGSEMATNLLEDDYDVVVYDIDDDRVEALVEKGAQRGMSIQNVADRVTVVMTSLPTSDIVNDVYFGDGGLLHAVDDETMFVEMSTIEASVVEIIATEAKGNEVVDCPVIGTPSEAAAATLTIVAGCSETAFERVRPILKPLGNRIDHVEGVGTAKRIKLANNVMTYGNFAIAAEMTALIEEMGIDARRFFDITRSGAASSAIADAKMPKALDGDYEPGFTVDGARGDLQYALSMKEDADFSAPLASSVAERYTFAASADHGERDYSVLQGALSKRWE
ncbi:NAD(P)-dependent oxidoreductase [Haloarcula sp. JP-L23]|uniref:NAD(P)-dependent oxidoreductase n=1 Tax=Haloarcula sp. JP-L23 TaxID=2716717 RepID=UPI00140EE8DA|nr:NAD(P)-dependent oxidoreductase [Haloarcula sp. JP-L23]